MSHSPCGKRYSPAMRGGLTLLELIVALGILAVLATVAVNSLHPLADQTRYEATQRVLDELREATVGHQSRRQINGQPIISGLIADTGLLPTSIDDFLTRPAAVIPHAMQSFDSDRDSIDDVTLWSGWRGPYIHLGAGHSSLVDGWGRAPLIDSDSGDTVFTSLGSDNDSVAPEDGYREDLSVTIPPAHYSSDVVFRVFEIDDSTGARINPAPVGSQKLGVMLYCVNGNGGTTGAIEEIMLPIAGAEPYEVSKAGVIHGTVAARAFMWTDTAGKDQLDVGETILLASYIHYFNVVGGADTRIEMELR